MAENYLTVEHLTKTYGDKTLFDDIGFGINKGQKTALVAKNGSGKSTLLKILAGKETSDSGTVSLRKGISIGYLEQHPLQGVSASIMDVLFESPTPLMQAVRGYEEALQLLRRDDSEQNRERLTKAMSEMDACGAWDYEARIREILGRLNIRDLGQNVATLSGGERKKVALCMVLMSESEVLLLDEPTNHLDIGMIEWLEDYLSKANQSLLLVSHDRYFIDKVSTDIYELDNCSISRYQGNFAYYLEKKAEHQAMQASQAEKNRNLYRKELEWMRRMPQARGTKSRARIDAFFELEDKLSKAPEREAKAFSVKSQRIGSKILEINNISKSYDGKCIIADFSHTYKKGDKIGIVGTNGCGKTTFLDIITSRLKPDSGRVVVGQTIQIGYYTQQTPVEKPDTKAIDIIKRVSDSIALADGSRMSASQYLNHFGIAPQKQFTDYALLSGGEKRLLYLLSVLIANPNFLILDEPTNDLDIYTQMKLEAFLEDYEGCLLVVSHDRHFLDKVCSQLFVFQGSGKIKEYPFSYTDYLESEKVRKKEEQSQTKASKPQSVKPKPQTEKRKLSYKEQREKEQIEVLLPELEKEKGELEEALSGGSLSGDELTKSSVRYKEVCDQIDQMELRWLELSD